MAEDTLARLQMFPSIDGAPGSKLVGECGLKNKIPTPDREVKSGDYLAGSTARMAGSARIQLLIRSAF